MIKCKTLFSRNRIRPVLLTATAILSSAAMGQNRANKPNIILIVADDLGYGELGCYGQKRIETPNIDQLASNGMRFTQFYAGAAVCAPSRCSLLTGKHTGHTTIRGNDQLCERGSVENYRAMFKDSTLEGQRPMSERDTTLAMLLQRGGYTTGLVGKWGLGPPNSKSTPTEKGFDFFYGYNCQWQAHTYYPLHLYRNNRRVYLQNDTVPPDTGFPPGTDLYDLKNYSRFTLKDYSAELIFKELTGFVDANRHRPFFMVWATTIPHVPIQAPQRWVDYYVRKFGDEKPYAGNKGYFPHRYPHAGYAAMVSFLDEQVGLLVAQLKALGIDRQTIILFTSDNGPTYNGGSDSPWFNSGGPFRSEFGRGKGFLYEGGIRVPLIATWPGHIRPGTVSNYTAAFWDLLPTLCEAGKSRLTQITDGISFYPTLLGKKQSPHPFLYWESPELGGQQAVRLGPWKGIRMLINKGNLGLELYNLDNDLLESTNLANQHPEIVRELEQIMQKEHVPANLAKFKLSGLGE